ncbi:MAG: CDP-diacylglycerol--glycerol-3-phosphate 3-phosphatidyltransferase [Pseudomonadota bacterium]
MNVPNLITLIRILLVPLFVCVYYAPWAGANLAAASLFAVAAATDWLDGYLARSLNQMTRFGAFLDPVADKIIVVTALVMLIGSHASPLLTLPGLVIVGREIVISSLRAWMAELNRRGLVEVSLLGKVKTTVQMVALILLLATPAVPLTPWVWSGYGLLYVAAALTLWSMILYLRAAWPTLREGMAPIQQDR